MPATPRQVELTPEEREFYNTHRDEIARYRREVGGPLPARLIFNQFATPLEEDTETFLEMFRLDQLAFMPPVEWLIPNIVEKQGLTILAGRYNTGKTFVALDWALSLAAGAPEWLGHQLPAEPKKVMYFMAEGFRGAHSRVNEWKAQHPDLDPDPNMVMVQEAVSFYPGDKGGTTATERIAASLELIKPDLVVLDTYSRLTAGMDEDSATAVNKMVPFFAEMMQQYGTSFLIVHHPTKSGSAIRGSGALAGAAEVVMVLEHGKHGALSLTWSPDKEGKVKNAAIPPNMPLALEEGEHSLYVTLDHSIPEPTKTGRPQSSEREAWLEAKRRGEIDGMSYREQSEQFGVSKSAISNWNKEADELPEPELL